MKSCFGFTQQHHHQFGQQQHHQFGQQQHHHEQQQHYTDNDVEALKLKVYLAKIEYKKQLLSMRMTDFDI